MTNHLLSPLDHHRMMLTRRALFGKGAAGLGAAALSSLLARDGLAVPADKAAPVLPHFAPKAKRVIYLLQNGAPSHVDLFDYKPALAQWHGRQIPDSVVGGGRFSTMTGGQTERPVLHNITNFARHGQSGAWVSDFTPHMAEIADELCFIKSMHTTQVNHAPAITFVMTGSEQAGRPSMGAWLSYGLGSDSNDLPSFVVMTSRDKEASCGQIFYDFYWGSGFLPSKYQGVKFRGSGDPVLYLSNPEGMSRSMRRGILDDLAKLNEIKLAEYGDPEINTRISQYEMAYRMQSSVPELTDFSNEPQHILDMYGPDVKRQGSYAYNCLMARRLAERGVRFVQLMHAGWDQHRNLNSQLKIQAADTDAPSAALVKDLKQRGLLDDTLIIWGGEFGRTPFLQGKIADTKQWGRDHHPYAFTVWMAGGGIKRGLTYGESDEFGFNAVKDPVDIHDFQATILHLLGIDHERFTFRFQGRQFRLTDVHGNVVKECASIASMQSTLRVLNQLEADGVIRRYAIGGAMGMMFHAEPLLTYDLDVFVFLADSSSLLVSLEPIYAALREQGWKEDKEHIIIAGMPVQFIPAYNALVNESVEQAVETVFQAVPVRVASYEHLLAIMLQTGRPKDISRIQELLEQRQPVSETWLPLLQRHDLMAKWNSLNQSQK